MFIGLAHCFDAEAVPTAPHGSRPGRRACTPALPASLFPIQGTAQAFQAALANQPLLILAALISVYIVLGVLYESLVHPVTILSTLPSAHTPARASGRLARRLCWRKRLPIPAGIMRIATCRAQFPCLFQSCLRVCAQRLRFVMASAKKAKHRRAAWAGAYGAA
ncbi:hypothetical protein JCM14124_19580 [Humidesulfovibrio idahonensis]